MQNLEQASIPLIGPGLYPRVSDQYGPGEYKKFKNLNITPEGTLRKRRPVNGLINKGIGANADKIIGSWGSDVLFTGHDSINRRPYISRSVSGLYIEPINYTSAASNKTDLIAATNSSVYALGSEYNNVYLEGMLSYNKSIYGIFVLSFTNADTVSTRNYSYEIYVLKSNSYNYQNPSTNEDLSFISNTLLPSGQSSVEYSQYPTGRSITHTNFNTIPPSGNLPIPEKAVTGFSVHKERLLIAVDDTVYFSKATDPTDFRVSSGGGFFRFPGQKIKKVVSLNDLIYVFFDSSIFVITYNTDPNIDPQIRRISDGVGGEDATVYGDLIYFINYGSIYIVKGLNVSKLIDLEILTHTVVTHRVANDLVALTTFAYKSSLKLDAWNNGLYFYERQLRFGTPDESIHHTRYASYGPMYRLDLDSGYISEYTFGISTKSYPVADSIVSYPSTLNSESSLFLYHSNTNASFSNFFYFNNIQSFFYSPTEFYQDTPWYGVDSYQKEGVQELEVVTIPIELELSNFSPDAVKYFIKKFRSILIQANLSSFKYGTSPNFTVENELLLTVEAGLSDFSGAHPFIKTVILQQPLNGDISIPAVVASRHGINQKARSLSINIKTRSEVVALTRSWTEYNLTNLGQEKIESTNFELVDISVLWTPSRRGPTNSLVERS